MKFKSFLRNVQNGFIEFIHYCFMKKPNINNYLYSNVNKLIIQKNASNLGLEPPPSITTNSKKRLIEFAEEHNHIVTKTANESLFFGNNELWLNVYTEKITDDFIKNLPDKFPPSFFQKQIQKHFEIRSFYIDSEFYSMAIFSQNNEKTQVDFRHYDKNKPNRNVPFQLPKHIEHKADALMKMFKLNSGSLDFIYGDDKKFYFLEVNPVGQFGMVSYPCNYYLEQLIAHKLNV